MSEKTVDRTEWLEEWKREHRGTLLWETEDPESGASRIAAYRVFNSEGKPKTFLTQRWGDGECRVYVPASESIRIDATLDALDEWLES